MTVDEALTLADQHAEPESRRVLAAEVRRLREENETLRALRDELFERLKPKLIHSCDIPGCISCGNPPDEEALRGGEEG